ncbi:hypothetical protein [Cyclobacterium marinum]|uniref:Uncharacterized protein n=1 Tax=Cyclobacterium marinum (strain ATCC 25205 / DSM 745 / LMG 13164 / NCIMB 1802) TaxID=880070 RepID=G0J701_CYCMS|nr:hypothetical protein [Cyclobacterium marinum]AEL26892.1 hypothetical protein Cycma_3164 [Cyclobacterium marinum DSM 745]
MNIKFYKLTIIFSVIFGILVTMTSCDLINGGDEDDDNTGDYMITFQTEDGLKEFTSEDAVVGLVEQNDKQHTAIFSGGSSDLSIGLQIYDDKNIAESTYSGYSIDQSTSTIVGVGLIFIADQEVYISSYYQQSDVVIKISELTSNSARGTFSGSVRSSLGNDLTITEGKFYVPLEN